MKGEKGFFFVLTPSQNFTVIKKCKIMGHCVCKPSDKEEKKKKKRK